MLLNLLKQDVTANYFFTRPLSDYAHSRAFSLIYLVYILVGRWKEGRKDAKPNEQTSEARKEVIAKQGSVRCYTWPGPRGEGISLHAQRGYAYYGARGC